MKKRNTPIGSGNNRFFMLGLVFINVVINYIDRSNIAIAATDISRDMKLNAVQMGFIFSSFGWTYVLFQIPGGLLTDRLGPRVAYAVSLFAWSSVTVFQMLAKAFGTLLGLRMAMGVFEAPAFPISNRIVTAWFPEKQRASAIGIYTSGQFIGLALLTPMLLYIEHTWGWRGLFLVTGLVGLGWSLIWYWLYRDPEQSNIAAMSSIEMQSGLKPKKQLSFRQKSAIILNNRSLWGIYIGQYALASTLWFFLTWFPTYLIKYRGLDVLKSGSLASIPFLAAFIGVITSGLLSDKMLRLGVSIGLSRKMPIIAGLFFSTFIIGANYVQNTWLVILFMSIAFFGNGLASISWVFVSILAPKHLIGAVGGVFNFMGGLASITIPLIIGYLVNQGSFTNALIFIGGLALVGMLAYTFLVKINSSNTFTSIDMRDSE